jgi:biotin carboxyl carrier protein
MPGTVVAIAVVVGEDVSAGVPVVVVEAMKMEHTVVAPRDGRVTQLSVAIGQKVALGQVLARIDDTIDPDTSDPDTGADTIEEEDD